MDSPHPLDPPLVIVHKYITRLTSLGNLNIQYCITNITSMAISVKGVKKIMEYNGIK